MISEKNMSSMSYLPFRKMNLEGLGPGYRVCCKTLLLPYFVVTLSCMCLSYDITSVSDTTKCTKIDKPISGFQI